MNRFFRLCGATTLVLCLGAITSYGQHSGKGNSKDKDGNNEETTVNSSGQQVAVDNNGKLRQPTPEEVKKLTESLVNNDSIEGLTVTTLPDGGAMVDLQGRFQSVAIAKKNPDGSIAQACVESSKQAENFLNGKLPVKKSGAAANQAAPVAPVSKKTTKPAELEVK